jgi:predicted Zn-dependent protease
MKDTQASAQVKSEARYNRAKAYLALNQPEKALDDLKLLAEDTRTSAGAEAKYLLANTYFEQNKPAAAEDEIIDFTKKNTPHQFWLARSLVLLADINMKSGDDFQAKQYLLSLQRNYTADDEIQTLISERLAAINKREKLEIRN